MRALPELRTLRFYNILGVCARVEGGAEWLELLGELLEPFGCTPGTGEPHLTARLIRREHTCQLLTPEGCYRGTMAEVIQHCEWWLVSSALGLRGDLCSLHGGAVADNRGAILLPGPSGSGKTTLTLGLLQAGFAPLCDDLILLDTHRPGFPEIQPFERCFHIDPGTLRMVDELGLSDRLTMPQLPGFCRPLVWSERRRPELIVFSRYQKGAHLHWECLRPGQTWLALAEQLIGSPDRHASFKILTTLADSIPAYRLTHGDLRAATEAIEKLFDAL